MRTSKELKKLKKDTIRLIDKIENAKEFPANPSRLCGWCRLKPICKRDHIPVKLIKNLYGK